MCLHLNIDTYPYLCFDVSSIFKALETFKYLNTMITEFLLLKFFRETFRFVNISSRNIINRL